MHGQYRTNGWSQRLSSPQESSYRARMSCIWRAGTRSLDSRLRWELAGAGVAESLQWVTWLRCVCHCFLQQRRACHHRWTKISGNLWEDPCNGQKLAYGSYSCPQGTFRRVPDVPALNKISCHGGQVRAACPRKCFILSGRWENR